MNNRFKFLKKRKARPAGAPEVFRPHKTETGDMSAELMNTVNAWLKTQFGRKMVKLSIDGGFTCPNRDGTKGVGGCLFCGEGAGGDFASDISDQIRLLSKKWPDAGYIAYFQNHTNTYAPVKVLREKFSAALKHQGIEGIAIATRPDCLSEEVLDLLDEINQDHFMWLELGLQTIHEETADLINRCYSLDIYEKAIYELNKRNIKTVTHLVLGLPGETKENMRESVEYVCSSGTWGIKLHLLNVVRNSGMAILYPDYLPFESPEDYIDLVCDLIEIIPPEITIHRLTGDAPRNILISPEWSYKKRTILNGINAELKRRGSWQGCKCE